MGAAVGQQMDGKNGAIIGGAIGGATGAAIGAKDDKRAADGSWKDRRVVAPAPAQPPAVVHVREERHDHGKHKGHRKHKPRHNHGHDHHHH